MNSIKYPEFTTYFIASTGANFAYGSVGPQQEMVTPYVDLWTTLDEIEWKSKLETEFNVDFSDLAGAPIFDF